MPAVMPPHPSKAIVAMAIATGNSGQAAAKIAGMNNMTVYRWQREEEFQNDVKKIRSDILNQASGKLIDSMSQAIDTLKEILLTATSDQSRLRAATYILEYSIRFHEIVSLEQRINNLEAKQERLSNEENEFPPGQARESKQASPMCVAAKQLFSPS